MADPHVTLAVVTSRDGFIARAPDHPPQAWASAEEQALFFAEVEAADWAVMGRNTHQAADKPHRRRIIFSRTRQAPEWRRSTQLWLDPADMGPAALPRLVGDIHPLYRGLILGGTAVHDWFHAHRSIHQIKLTIEPESFGDGLPVFSGQTERDPVAIFSNRGYRVLTDAPLNPSGTRLVSLEPT